MSSVQDRSGGPATAAARRPVGPALTRYRVMAWVTGGFLLLLTVEMVLKYVLRVDVGSVGTAIAVIHGWIYVVYLVTVFDLWSKLRWRFGRFVALVLAGVVPVLSFVVERRIVREVRASGVLR